MIKKRIGRLRLEIYDSIKELPIERYHQFNIYCLLSTGIGADVEGINKHYADIFQSLEKKDYKRLKTLFQNYYYCLHLIIEHMDLPSLAFACLVKSINERDITDFSEDNLKHISERLTRAAKRQLIFDLFKDLKKKLRTKRRYFFRKSSKVRG